MLNHMVSYTQRGQKLPYCWDLESLLTLRLFLLHVIGSKVFPLIFKKPSIYFQDNLHLEAAKRI